MLYHISSQWYTTLKPKIKSLRNIKTMSIDSNMLKKLEKLSSLCIEDNKKETMVSQLHEIVNFVDILNNLELEEDMMHLNLTQEASPMRNDEVLNDSETIQTIFKFAPKKNESFFVVPKIIE